MLNIMSLFKTKRSFKITFGGGINRDLRVTIMIYLDSVGARCDRMVSFGSRIQVFGESFKTNEEIENSLRTMFKMIDVRKTKNGIFISNKDETL